MRKPSAATGLIAVSLLLCAWGNVIAVCFCPRYSMDHDHSLTQRSHVPVIQQESACTHEMPDMKMDGVRMDDVAMESEVLFPPAGNLINGMQPTNQKSIEHAFESSGKQRRHCLMFSASKSVPANLAVVNPTKRALESDVPPAKVEVALAPPLSISIIPSEHGPPGNLFPRHILISVFRI